MYQNQHVTAEKILNSLDKLQQSGYDFTQDKDNIVGTIIRDTEYPEIINKLSSLNINLEKALHLSITENNSTALNALITRGANPNYQDPVTGKTPLHIAIEGQNSSIVQTILSYGKVDFGIRDKNDDNVHHIAFRVDKDNAISKMLKNAILEDAIYKGSLDRMNDIIKHGADIRNVDKKGNNVLHRLAASSGPINSAVIQKALDCLPNLDSLLVQHNQNGETPVDIARASPNAAINKLLGALLLVHPYNSLYYCDFM